MDRPYHIVTDIYTAQPRLRAVSSKGAKVTLSDGKQYIDLMNGKGSVTLGHHHPVVNSAITRHLHSGLASATCWSDLHEALTERIIDDVGMSDAQLALFSTGTEACRAAVQVARQFTGRHVIASAGYHGWGDYWASSDDLLEANASGVIDFYFIPELLEQVLERHRGQTALVILSPDHVHLQPDRLRRLAQLVRHEGVLLCCDDVKQGYRSVRASQFPGTVGFQADLYTFAKGLSNGHRLSCLVGRRDVMAAAKEFTYTAYLDTIPIVAALATLDYMDNHDGYQRLVQCGAALAAEMRNIVQRSGLPIEIYGEGPLLQIVGASEALDQTLYANWAMAGLLLYEGDNQAVSLATGDVLDELLERFEKGLTATSRQFGRGNLTSITLQRRFQAAFRMMDGASDVVPVEDAVRWIKEER
ncbi:MULTISPECIES: aminotransferase class III-fold pyridoxal phosphate-dependent enzyme [unclassified Pseudomonas]|uniref:aminotransferase class III-fold pyridoxal phosphate-dependent enzyme n=1 Tax=unclassified Pseudomonas TaxID=196821 RepID=UPI0021C8AB5A|nr:MULTISPECIES: aminotransferase class III-fold pyridoxal phosphate-dependent enzyme [unclassified Pseudomonas]MCU1730127.1 aminotransferase class III-fold pyridoxal phosphate-dependent enzyme [Pseudomonas sp. 20P_3.2_Bac4]MCU1747562.1 aminotransferase class III-fold pyridoxal phosphate-dependent enzyme [Pseudomonas sp. 20P_3.2_Bac5]